jgi:hypothetical protein
MAFISHQSGKSEQVTNLLDTAVYAGQFDAVIITDRQV